MTERQMAARLRERGWGTIPPEQYRIDMEPEFLEIWRDVEEYTMTYSERGYALFKAVEYLTKNRIAGDFAECGVWRGGSCMLMALTLRLFNAEERMIHLYDTFAGMTEPTDEDVITWNDRGVREKWEKDTFESWAVGVKEVQQNMVCTGYSEAGLRYVVGDVEQTLEKDVPAKLALLRLDTDWYRSTRKELEVLYPKLVPGGILIIDDYGHFKGAKKAVDDYFEETGFYPFFSRSDYTGRICVKS